MTVVAGKLIRRARRAANLSQAELASRLGVAQSTIARLESAGSNPRVATLERTLAGTGNELKLDLERSSYPGIDESLLRSCLERTPAERLDHFASAYKSVRQLAPTVRSD